MRLAWNEKDYQPPWYPNFADDFKNDYFKQFEAEDRMDEYDQYGRYKRTIWKPKHGAANHALDTYCYNVAALEIFATLFCKQVLNLKALDLDLFWAAAKEGIFYDESGK
jgi:phage terminase large subunit GpA-like protein